MSRRRAFDEIADTIESPMVIVTARAADQMDGCLVGFSSQCSIEPVRYLVCLSTANLTSKIACRAATLVVHMLHDSPHDRELARLFGEETAYETDKLTRCAWKPGPDDTPVLAGCDWFAGPIVDRFDLGDHLGFVLAVGDEGSAEHATEPYLSYRDVRDLDAGRAADEA